MRVALIASARYAVDQPFAGGLESHTWSLARGLRRRGHEVVLFAAGSADTLASQAHPSHWVQVSPQARADVSMTTETWVQEHHAYLGFMLELARGTGRFDVVHNNSIHYLPVAMARSLATPMVTTLHTPPTPWLESAIQVAACPVTFVAVSEHTAQAWRHVVPAARVVRNGVDLDVWRPGPGGGPLIWFGRMVPEKGPHLAIAAARRAGLSLDLVGPRFDERYFAETVEPAVGGRVRYLGHLDHRALAARVARASGVLVTPCWDEPYGLVAAEALACGTPVAGFARGALPEIVGPGGGVLVRPGDVDGLAVAAAAVVRLDRGAARRRAETFCSVEGMLDGYEQLYRELVSEAAA